VFFDHNYSRDKSNLFLVLQNTLRSRDAIDSPILLVALQTYNPESARDTLLMSSSDPCALMELLVVVVVSCVSSDSF